MAECVEDPRIVVPFVPTLLHMSIANFAVQFCGDFRFMLRSDSDKVAQKALKELESRNVSESKEDSPDSRVKENLARIPVLLRRRFLTAIEGVEREMQTWRYNHHTINRFGPAKYSIFWRCDGTIDCTKTAQEMSRNPNVHMNARFEIACMYCLADEVQTLWVDLKANGLTEIYEERFAHGLISESVLFWSQWMLGGCEVPWTQAILRDPHPPPNSLNSYHFRSLLPEERRDFLPRLDYLCTVDNLRFCLYASNRQEQECIMKKCSLTVLLLHLKWPLTSEFLQIAEKSWNFLDKYSFCCVLENLLNCNRRKDVDFEYLAKEFWKQSPPHLREYAMKHSSASNLISKFLETFRLNQTI